MKQIRIITIGRKSSVPVKQLTDEYEKRLSRSFKINWLIIDNDRTKQLEGAKILDKLDSQDYVILLDETGEMFSTEQIAAKFKSIVDINKTLVFIIGGAYGVSDAVKQRADLTWSFSKQVFPHQLMRIMLLEQLYRINSINSGSKYHHA